MLGGKDSPPVAAGAVVAGKEEPIIALCETEGKMAAEVPVETAPLSVDDRDVASETVLALSVDDKETVAILVEACVAVDVVIVAMDSEEACGELVEVAGVSVKVSMVLVGPEEISVSD